MTEYQKEARTLAKRINQRLLRAERREITFLKEYKDIMSLISSGTFGSKSGKRFKETYTKYSENELRKIILPKLRRAVSFETIHGKKAVKAQREIQDKFRSYFGTKVSMKDINDYIELEDNENWRNGTESLSSEQKMVIVMQVKDVSIIGRLTDEYVEAHKGQMLNSADFMNYLKKNI